MSNTNNSTELTEHHYCLIAAETGVSTNTIRRYYRGRARTYLANRRLIEQAAFKLGLPLPSGAEAAQ